MKLVRLTPCVKTAGLPDSNISSSSSFVVALPAIKYTESLNTKYNNYKEFLGTTPIGVLPYCHRVRRPSLSLFVQSETVVYLENGLT